MKQFHYHFNNGWKLREIRGSVEPGVFINPRLLSGEKKTILPPDDFFISFTKQQKQKQTLKPLYG